VRELILSRLRDRGAEDRLATEARLERELRELERELAEVRQLIPAWSRIFFFVESADERREKDLKAQIVSRRRERDRARAALRADLDEIALELPPLGLACQLEDALESARPHSSREASLVPALEALARRLVGTWAPGFDPAATFVLLESASACQDLARKHAELPRDERLVHAPANEERLLPLLARRVLETGYFAEQERTAELTTRRSRLGEEHEAAALCVGLLEKLNPFSTSPSEKRRNALAEELERTRTELRLSRAEGRRLLEECVRAYPPLSLHRQALEAIAVASTHEPTKELALGAGGLSIEVPVDRARILVAASLARLEATFREAFPGVPLPGELARDLLGKKKPLPAPLEPLVRAFTGELTRSGAPSLLEKSLEHAHAAAAAHRGRERVEERIPFASRLAFWHETEEKDERDALRERETWHEEQSRLARVELVARAREMGGVLAPFRLRDVTLETLHDLEHVSTDPGEHPATLLPSVYGIDAVARSLKAVRRVLAESWRLEGTEAELLEAVAVAEPEDVEIGAHERLLWKPLSRESLAGLLAYRLEHTGFQETVRRVQDFEARERSLASEKDEVGSRLSIWDHLNVFSKSPDKERHKELKRSLHRLGVELEASVERLRAHLDHALHVYPPAQLYYSLFAVERAVAEIHAVCKPIWITVRYREPVLGIMDEEEAFEHREASLDSGPLVIEVGRPREPQRWVERERQELRYICVLVGKEEAQHALGAWASRVVGCFGELPGYHELLETWAGGSYPATIASSSSP
jgi:hypothetical protein